VREKKSLLSQTPGFVGVPGGIQTRVTALKGQKVGLGKCLKIPEIAFDY
jgi:hypothetical protein